MTLAISGHGTTVSRALSATPTVWTVIGEMGDVTPPVLSRNEFDATTQDRNIDAYVLGVLRRSAFTMSINFLGADTTAGHDHLTGLMKAMITEPPPVDGYKITFPDGIVWVMSGQVQSISPKAPVDGKMSADVTVRPTGKMTIGTVAAPVVVG